MAPDRTILHLVEKKMPYPPLNAYGVHTIKSQLRAWISNIICCGLFILCSVSEGERWS